MALRKTDDSKVLEIANSLRDMKGIPESDKKDNKFSVLTTPNAINDYKAPTGNVNYSYTNPNMTRFDLYSGFKNTYMIRASGTFDPNDSFVYVSNTSSNGTSNSLEGNRTLYKYQSAIKEDGTYKTGIQFTNDNPSSYLRYLYGPQLYKQRVIYMNPDNSTVFHTEYVNYAESAVYSETPTKASSVAYTYTFNRWSDSKTGSSTFDRSDILKDVILYPQYTSEWNTYHVYFYNGDKLLYVDEVEYGDPAVYRGSTPTSSLVDPQKRSGYKFWKWDADISYVLGDMYVNALFWGTYNDLEIDDAWWEIASSCNDGENSYRQKYSVGMYKDVYWSVGSSCRYRCRIVGVDADQKVDGNKAALSFIMEDIVTYGVMDTHATNDYLFNGWSACSTRGWLDGLIDSFEWSVCENIKSVVKTSHYGTSGTQITTDRLWVPSRKELGISGGNAGTTYNTTARNEVRNNLYPANGNSYIWYWTRDSINIYKPNNNAPIDYTAFYQGEIGGSTYGSEYWMAHSGEFGIPVGFCL